MESLPRGRRALTRRTRGGCAGEGLSGESPSPRPLFKDFETKHRTRCSGSCLSCASYYACGRWPTESIFDPLGGAGAKPRRNLKYFLPPRAGEGEGVGAADGWGGRARRKTKNKAWRTSPDLALLYGYGATRSGRKMKFGVRPVTIHSSSSPSAAISSRICGMFSRGFFTPSVIAFS